MKKLTSRFQFWKRHSQSGLLVNQHDFDQFYIDFENKFRGTEAEIKKRLGVYLPYLTPHAHTESELFKVIDLGSGRGEMLELLKEHNVDAVGVDLNKNMVARCQQKGLDVVRTDALSFVAKQRDESYGAITSMHLVEHLPFETIYALTKHCKRILKPGGYLIYETPNPENIIVAAHTFYIDPSHLRPLPPQLLAFLFEYQGFSDVQIKRFHPIKKSIHDNNPLTQETANHLFGPADYAVIGRK